MNYLACFSKARILLSSGAMIAAACAAYAQSDVFTGHNDVARTGQNLQEAILTPAQVNSSYFGLVHNVHVDGKVDAQPLYISELGISTGLHNVLYIATEHDSVYAINADSGAIYWRKTMLPSGETPSDDRGCAQVSPEIGITATPVIDRTAGPHGRIYVVAMSKDASGKYYHRIHALDLITGAEELNGPVTVQATYPGTGDGSSDGTVTFDPARFKERPGLLLVNGTIYTSWGSHCDIRPYGGWMMAYDQQTLKQTAVLDFTPNGSQAAPWNAGAGPAADGSGSVYISLGNGTFDSALTTTGFPDQADYGNSLVKLALNGSTLQILDYWTMYNSDAESSRDTDLGSGGLMLLPDEVDSTGKTRHLSVAAGKDGNLYVADRDKMGHYDATNDGTIYQQLSGVLPGGVWSSPAYFNGHVYYGPTGGSLLSFPIASAKLGNSPQSTSVSFVYPGATPSVSAYGENNGIVWAVENTSPAVLHAFDANNLSTELYNSNQAASSRDHFGIGNKFMTPTIANGKVFVATIDSVAIFGFLSHSAPPLADGDYEVINLKSKLRVEDPGSSGASGIPVDLSPSTGRSNQLWFVSYNGRGFYTIQNLSSHLFLTDPNSSTTPGESLEQATPNDEDDQLWSLTPSGSGFVVKSKSTGFVFDDPELSNDQGAHIGLSPANGSINQTWAIQ